ncbi:4883_t:CDS:2 [Racocetra fulgida]|uniref:4883_t:CDS:1 n=1 Tax=Racocetra fulgida TaxID=60492 RepID=A0A9N8Z4I9_9GLOM|nr:4883_t:CDS:2 [Racocetra fulgida]
MSSLDQDKIHLRGEYGKVGGPTTVAGQTLSGVQTVGDAVTPFVPLFNMVTSILSQMLSIYENAKCNEKICLALLDRVEIAQTAVKSLQRKYQANEKNFRDQNYYYAWVRFVNVLDNIRKFSKEVTQLTYFQKFINANAVKDAFEKNIKEFEEVCNDLNFTMAMYNAEQREIEAKNVAEDLEMLKRVLYDEIKAEIRLAITEVTTLVSNANQLGSQIKSGDPVDKTAPRVDPVELSEPYASNDNVRDEPSARPSDIEMQQKLKDLFNEHVFSKGISPQINPKKTDSGDIPGLELPKSFQEKVSLSDSQQSIEQFETPDECDVKAEPYIKLAALKGQPKAIVFLDKIKAEKARK